MAQSTLEGQRSSDNYMQSQSWEFQPVSQRNIKLLGGASADKSSTMANPLDQTWSGATDVSTSFDWQLAIQKAGPYILRESDSQNDDLLLAQLTAHNAVGKGFEYTGQAVCAPPKQQGLPSYVKTVLSSTNSLSPKSYDSDGLDNSYSPGPMPMAMPNQTSSYDNSKRFQSSPPITGLPTPKAESYLTDAGLTGLPRMRENTELSLPSYTGCSEQGQQAQIPEKASFSASGYCSEHDSSLDTSSWYNVQCLPFTDKDCLTQRHPGPSNRPHTSHIQAPIQFRFQTPRSPSAQAIRDYNDWLLIEGKRKGETYKEIKKKMIGESPAESTLRGRYRSLTKARSDRVRKPVWTKIDIDLLTETVQCEIRRIENNPQNPVGLTMEQKLVKISWKKVADYIEQNGGSYHFGNSTCKRKWLELNPLSQ